MAGNEFGLRGFFGVGEFARIAARARGVLERVGHDELGAKRFDLLARRGTHVGRRHHGPEPARRGDRLQSRNARAHDEDLGGTDRAGSGHHHRHGALEDGGSLDHRLVAGEIGLAGKDIHHLGAGDARHELHRNERDAGISQSGDVGLMPEGIHAADDESACRDALEHIGTGAADGEDHIRTLGNRSSRAERGACCSVVRIGESRLGAGIGFNGEFGTKCHESGNGFRRCRHAGLAFHTFAQDGDLHKRILNRHSQA